MSKESTAKALNNFMAREARKSLRRPRKNAKPEFEFKKQIVKWLESESWIISVVESKGVYNFSAGRYDQGQAEQGFSDLVGLTPYFGVGAFIELKAPGKRSRLEAHQREFLLARIKLGAFACCTDSVEHIKNLYTDWYFFRVGKCYQESIDCLIVDLPAGIERAKDTFDPTTF